MTPPCVWFFRECLSPVFPSTPYWLLSSSLAKWQDSLITQMGHQNFNIEQETKLPRSGRVHQNSPKSVKGKGYWVTAPHPPSPLRLWSRKPGRFPRCQKPVNNYERSRVTLSTALSCLAEALHDPCSGLSGQGSVAGSPLETPLPAVLAAVRTDRCAQPPLHPAGLSKQPQSSGRVGITAG